MPVRRSLPGTEVLQEEPILWAGPYDYGVDIKSVDEGESVEEMLAGVRAEAGSS